MTGTVLNNMTNEPVSDAVVSIGVGSLTTVTNQQGEFVLERIPVEQFTVSIQRKGYTTIDAADFSFEGQREMQVEIRMLHPELAIDPGEVLESVAQNSIEDVIINVANAGDGPLEYTSRLRAVNVEGQLWDPVISFNAGAVVSDARCQAAIFFQDHYWIAGGNSFADDINQMYKLTREGELVDQWDQISESNYGWRDLTHDGEFIYGVDANYICQIDPATGRETGVTIRSDYMPNPMYSITYDPARDIFWVAGPTSDIRAFDRRGEYIDLVNNNQRFRISGLAWFAEDPDGYLLYISSSDQLRNPEIVKVNYDTGESMFVCSMANDDDEKPGGGEFTNDLIPFTTTLVSQIQGRDDWIKVFEAGTHFEWISMTPLEVSLDPECSTPIEISFNTNGLEKRHSYNAYLQIDHNTPVEGAIWLDITLTVIEGTLVEGNETLPYEFGISAVYPNPFNPTTTIDFALDQTANVNLLVFDLSGRVMVTLASGELNAGQYNIPVDASIWPSGIYMVQLSDGSRVSLKKMTLIK